MGTLNNKIKKLENIILKLKIKIDKLIEDAEAKKTKPFSKVKQQIKFGNLNLIYDDIAGIYKTYAIYKDDDEE